MLMLIGLAVATLSLFPLCFVAWLGTEFLDIFLTVSLVFLVVGGCISGGGILAGTILAAFMLLGKSKSRQ